MCGNVLQIFCFLFLFGITKYKETIEGCASGHPMNGFTIVRRKLCDTERNIIQKSYVDVV